MNFKVFVVLLLIVFTGVSCIQPVFPDQQFLQHIGTAFIILVLIADIKNKIWSSSAFLGIALFTMIHIIGARYIYSYVPYDEFFKACFNFDIQQYFGWERNHYDRLVHFSFGLLILPSLYELILNKLTSKKLLALFIAWLILQTFSLCYELFEWSLSLIMSAENTENYNGQQGDIWDAQKDMALAMLGSSITSIVYWIKLN